MKTQRVKPITMFPSLTMLLFILAMSGFTQDEKKPESIASPIQTLIDAEQFAIGPIYADARTSKGELAMRSVLKSENAIENIREIISKATPEGISYGLFGLNVIEKEEYRKSIKDLKRKLGARVF